MTDNNTETTGLKCQSNELNFMKWLFMNHIDIYIFNNCK